MTVDLWNRFALSFCYNLMYAIYCIGGMGCDILCSVALLIGVVSARGFYI